MIESLTVTNFYCFKERTTILFTAKKGVSGFSWLVSFLLSV